MDKQYLFPGQIHKSREGEENKGATKQPDGVRNYKEDVWRTLLLDTLWNQYCEGSSLCDVTVSVGDEDIKCHWCVLLASPYLQSFYNGDMVKKSAGKIEFNITSPETFKLVLEYMYTARTDQIYGDAVFEVVKVADYLQLNTLKNKCGLYLRNEGVNGENFLDLLRVSEQFNLIDLQTTSKQWVVKHFQDIIGHDRILDAEPSVLLQFLSDVNLSYIPRDAFIDLIVRWVNHDLAGRCAHFDDLFGRVNLSLICTDDMRKIKKEQLVMKSKVCCYLIASYEEDVKKGEILPDGQRDVVLLGCDRFQDPCVFSLKECRWLQVRVKDLEDSFHKAICTISRTDKVQMQDAYYKSYRGRCQKTNNIKREPAFVVPCGKNLYGLIHTRGRNLELHLIESPYSTRYVSNLYYIPRTREFNSFSRCRMVSISDKVLIIFIELDHRYHGSTYVICLACDVSNGMVIDCSRGAVFGDLMFYRDGKVYVQSSGDQHCAVLDCSTKRWSPKPNEVPIFHCSASASMCHNDDVYMFGCSASVDLSDKKESAEAPCDPKKSAFKYRKGDSEWKQIPDCPNVLKNWMSPITTRLPINLTSCPPHCEHCVGGKCGTKLSGIVCSHKHDYSAGCHSVENGKQGDRRHVGIPSYDKDVWQTHLLETLWNQLCEGSSLCDVTVNVAGEAIKAHRCVLLACPYFQALYNCDMVERSADEYWQKGKMEFDITCPETFKLVLEFMYTARTDQISGDAVFEVIKVADYLQLNDLKELCSSHLEHEIIHEKNIFELLLLSELFSLHDLHKRAKQWAVIHFQELMGYDHILNVKFTTLLEFLSDENLSYVPRVGFIDLIIRWVEHDPADRSAHFDNLFCHVNLALVETVDIEKIKKSQLVMTSQVCCDLIASYEDDIAKGEIIPDGQKEVVLFPCLGRKIAFSLAENRWVRLPPVDDTSVTGYCCIMDMRNCKKFTLRYLSSQLKLVQHCVPCGQIMYALLWVDETQLELHSIDINSTSRRITETDCLSVLDFVPRTKEFNSHSRCRMVSINNNALLILIELDQRSQGNAHVICVCYNISDDSVDDCTEGAVFGDLMFCRDENVYIQSAGDDSCIVFDHSTKSWSSEQNVVPVFQCRNSASLCYKDDVYMFGCQSSVDTPTPDQNIYGGLVFKNSKGKPTWEKLPDCPERTYYGDNWMAPVKMRFPIHLVSCPPDCKHCCSPQTPACVDSDSDVDYELEHDYTHYSTDDDEDYGYSYMYGNHFNDYAYGYDDYGDLFDDYPFGYDDDY